MAAQKERLKANLEQRRAAAGKAGRLIGNSSTAEAAIVERNSVIESLMDQYGITAGDEYNEDLWSLLEAMTDLDTGDFPDLEWRGLFTGMFGDEIWDDNLDPDPKKNMRMNLENMREQTLQDVFYFLSQNTKSNAEVLEQNYRNGDPTAVEMVDNLVGRQEASMRGF